MNLGLTGQTVPNAKRSAILLERVREFAIDGMCCSAHCSTTRRHSMIRTGIATDSTVKIFGEYIDALEAAALGFCKHPSKLAVKLLGSRWHSKPPVDEEKLEAQFTKGTGK